MRTREEKHKGMPETDIELQKLEVLKKVAAKDPTPDALTTFGNQVVLEMRLIQDPGCLARLKKNNDYDL